MTPVTSPPAARRFWTVFAIGALVVLAGLFAAHVMETRGHIVTGMNNRIVWGLPHVFAIFLIVAASGVLNVASVGSVFRQAAYKPHAPLSGLLCLAMLAGGLAVLMLDLGRPERIIVAATHYNFTSVFAWNMFLYSGMAAIVAVYLWTLMAPRRVDRSRAAGIAAFAWRIVLTSGTGSIFAFLVARQAFGSAILIPLFLAMSLAWGLAVFLVAQSALCRWNGLALPAELRQRMQNLLALFVVAALFFVARLSPHQRLFREAGRVRALHSARRRRLPAALLVGLCRRRQSRAAVPALAAGRHERAGRAGRARGSSSAAVSRCCTCSSSAGRPTRRISFPGSPSPAALRTGSCRPTRQVPTSLPLGMGGIGIAFLITLVGARVLDFLPDAEIAAPQGVGAD